MVGHGNAGSVVRVSVHYTTIVWAISRARCELNFDGCSHHVVVSVLASALDESSLMKEKLMSSQKVASTILGNSGQAGSVNRSDPIFPTASKFSTKTSNYSMDSTLKENVSTMYVPWLVPMLSDGCPAALRNSQVQTLQS